MRTNIQSILDLNYSNSISWIWDFLYLEKACFKSWRRRRSEARFLPLSFSSHIGTENVGREDVFVTLSHWPTLNKSGKIACHFLFFLFFPLWQCSSWSFSLFCPLCLELPSIQRFTNVLKIWKSICPWWTGISYTTLSPSFSVIQHNMGLWSNLIISPILFLQSPFFGFWAIAVHPRKLAELLFMISFKHQYRKVHFSFIMWLAGSISKNLSITTHGK